MRSLPILALIALVLLPVSALATVVGGDFDNQPVGPYAGAADTGIPPGGSVDIVPANSPGHGAPIPGDGQGNMMCIDAMNASGPIFVTFIFWCDLITDGVCQLKYSYSGSASSINGGFGVYVDDDGSFSNPDDLWEPLVGFPNSTTQGDNTENEGDCDGAVHTVTFIVQPNTVLYLDDMEATCLESVVPNDEHSWGAMKVRY